MLVGVSTGKGVGGGVQGVFVGSWDGRMSCTESFLRSGMIPNGGGVLKKGGASGVVFLG